MSHLFNNDHNLIRMQLEQIIEKCKKNDRVAQNQLYQKYAPVFFSICLRYISVKSVAEDALVQAFYKIFSCIDQYNGAGNFEGWMKRILINECLMELRKNKNFALTVSIDEVKEDFKTEWQDNLTYEEILVILNELPDGYRTIFNLYVIEGYKHKEIAELLNISINTSKSQLILAKRKLQGIIKKKSNSNCA